MTKKTVHKNDSLPYFCPVVSVLGHVDHGKTSLLDKIRRTNVVSKEFGGITQHIGAYQITTPNNKKITFIDTPGHEAFNKMRSRGASVSDLAILVVSASDGVMPQTIESIKHIKGAKIPYIVAATKIDLTEAQIDKVKKQLSKNGVEIDEYGGNVPVVPVSSKTGQGIDKLLEMIHLISDLHEIKTDHSIPFTGVVIEAKIDKGKGPTATIIVRNGTIKQGDEIVTKDGVEGKVRAMFDESGQIVNLAFAGKPVEIIGLSKLVAVGSTIYKKGETTITGLQSSTVRGVHSHTSEVSLPLTSTPASLEIPKATDITPQKLKIILKADTAGSLEAILGSIKDNVEIVSSGTGTLNESDVILAKSSGAMIIGFNVKPSSSVTKLATSEKVMIKTYHIIYEMLKEIDEVVEALAKGGLEEVLGESKIIAQFEIKGEKVAGVRVVSGRVALGDKVKIMRGLKEIGRARIKSLRHQKEEITKAEMGSEAGLVLSPKLDFLPNDAIISIG